MSSLKELTVSEEEDKQIIHRSKHVDILYYILFLLFRVQIWQRLRQDP